MPEQLLNDAQVGAALEEVGRERMAQGVGRDPVAEAGGPGGPLDDRPGRLAAEPVRRGP